MRTERSRSGAALTLTVLFVALLLCIHGSNPASSRAQSSEPTETIRVDSDLVDLRVSIVRLKPEVQVSAFQQSDFVVLEDGKPQDIVFFVGEDAPFDLVLLLDLSGSTADKLKLIRSSAKRFVETTRPVDRVAIVTFTDVPMVISPLTSNRGFLKHAIDDIERPLGGTNFWDSLLYVMHTIVPSGNASRRSAVVVMTDGVDNALPEVFGDGSRTTFEELIEKLGRSDTIIFPIYLDTEKQAVKQNRLLKEAYSIARTQLAQLAEVSGTTVYTANKLKDLEHVYGQVIRDLSTVYSVGYKPTNKVRDGKWRSVVVQLVGRQDVSARTKPGYFARADQ